MPNIAKRKDGRWMVRWMIRGKSHARYFHTREEARLCADLIEEMMKQGAEPDGQTVSSWVHECMETYGSFLSVDTLKAYRSILRHHIDGEELGRVRLEDLRPIDLQRWVNGMSELSPKTVRNVAGVLNWALVKAVQNRLIVSNPMAAVTLPRKQKPVRKVLDPDRAAWLLERMQLEDWQDLPLWLFIASTGCRLSEALGIMYDNINLTTGDYTITQTVTVKDGVAIVQHRTKTSNAERSGRVPAEILPALRKKAAFNRTRSGTVEGWEENGLLFCDDHGRPFKRYTVMNRFFKYQLRHGISKDEAVGAHAFRHLVATMLIRAGVSDAAVARQMGHFSAAYTRAAYMDAYDSDREEVSRVTGRFIRSTWVRFPSLAPMKPGNDDE